MKSIFGYDDYRQYLRDHYDEKKAHSKSYSFRFLARKAQLGSPNYYKLVMDGQRNLTHRNVRKFAKALSLSDREQLYFENLVFFNQAKEVDEREFLKKNLELARMQDDRVLLTRDQYEVFSVWYPLAIKELLLVHGFDANPKKLAARFDHKFTPQQARDALDLLARLGLIELNEKNGLARVTKQNMQTPDLARSDALIRFHKAMTDMVKEALDRQSSRERCLSGLTVAVRKKDLPEAFRRIHEFRNDMDAFFSKGQLYDSVYQLNIHLFRLDCDVE